MNDIITPVIIEIGKINYQDINHYNDECPICLEDVDYENNNVVKLSCGHLLHQPCVIELFETQIENYEDLTCPICRKTLMNIHHRTYQLVRDNVLLPSTDNEETDNEETDINQENNHRIIVYNIAYICHILITISFIFTCIVLCVLYFVYLI